MSSTQSTNALLLPRNNLGELPENFALKGDQTTVGRHPQNDIILQLDSVSRFHARIDKRGDFYILQDLNSANGCYVNGERVTQMAIHHGDLVTFGNIEFEFSNETAQAKQAGTQSSLVGMDIIDIRDDRDTAKPTTQSYIKVEQEAGKTKSSVISSLEEKKNDKQSLMKLNQQIAALYRLSELLRELTPENERDILSKVLEIIFSAIAADRGVIMTRVHEASENFEVAAVKYRDAPIVQDKVRVSRTILEQVLRDRVAVLSRDAQSDERFNASESIVAQKVRSAICAPMLIGGKVLGVLFVDISSSGKSLSQDDLEYAMIATNETGMALHAMRMQKEAIHRQRLAAVGETVAGISHNVKNILLLQQGGSEILSMALDRKDMDGAKKAWSIVCRGIDKINKLVRDMLEYSSDKKPDLNEADINHLIEAIAEEINDQLVTKNISLELDMDEGIGKRMLDVTGMQRTLMNLIVNAMEAITHQVGEIQVTTSQKTDGTLVITVRDNGTGIPEEKIAKVFIPFYTTKGANGTGLGLSMCKKCIEDMSGTIRCESQESVGTTFIIEIPKETPE